MIHRLVGALLLALLALAAAGPSAYAGGTTSALLVGSDGRVAALHYTDPEFEALLAAVGSASVGDREQPAAGSEEEDVVRISWLAHDTAAWRLDTVRLTEQGMWVGTSLSGEDRSFGEPRWHRPADGRRLLALLRSAGLLGETAAPAGRALTTTGRSSAAPVPVPAAVALAPTVTAGAGSTAPLVLGAVLGGVVLGVVGAWLRLRPGRR